MSKETIVIAGKELAQYGFGADHPFGPDRHDAFYDEFIRQGLDQQVLLASPVKATRQQLESFHTKTYIDRVARQSASGEGFLDCGDTPAYPGIFDTASTVVGSTLSGIDKIMSGECKRVFIPIAGLHHARRDEAAGFCVFNDCGIAIEILRKQYKLTRIAYVDIDAHHGDGVFYSFEQDPYLCFVDFHEDGRYLYPGTGAESETGTGVAVGTKLNIAMPPDANDAAFQDRWPEAEKFLRKAAPEFILFQCGADSMAGDPITHMSYSEASHAFTTERLRSLADELCDGRLLAMGGGGYNRQNLAKAWCAVVNAMI